MVELKLKPNWSFCLPLRLAVTSLFTVLFKGMDSCRDTSQAQVQRHRRLRLHLWRRGPGNRMPFICLKSSFVVRSLVFTVSLVSCRLCLWPFSSTVTWNVWSLCSSPSCPSTWVPWSALALWVWATTVTFTTTSQTPVDSTWGWAPPHSRWRWCIFTLRFAEFVSFSAGWRHY